MIASTSRRARGMTRGLGIRGLVEKHGKLSVRIAPEFCDAVVEHAGKLASQIGVQVRMNLSLRKLIVGRMLIAMKKRQSFKMWRYFKRL